MPHNKLEIIIPVAGMSRRMKNYKPKCLTVLPNGETVLSRQIRLLSYYYPDAQINVITGYESDKVEETIPSYVRSIKNSSFADCNVAQSITIGLYGTPRASTSLIVYGDLIFNESALRDICISRSSIIIQQHNNSRQLEVGVNVVQEQVTRLSFGMPDKWAQIALLRPQEKKLFLNTMNQPSREKYFGYEILNEVIERGGSFHAVYPERLQLLEIDTPRDVEKLSKYVILD